MNNPGENNDMVGFEVEIENFREVSPNKNIFCKLQDVF